MKKLIPLILIAFIAGLLGGAFIILEQARSEIAAIPEPAYHAHADFTLFLNGEQFDFSKDKYMSNVPCKLTKSTWIDAAYAHGTDLEEGLHLHDNVGGVVHLHQEALTWHDFFESLKMKFEDNEFMDDEGNSWKNDEENSFRFFINGQEVETIVDTIINDLDRVLITYGPRDREMSEINAELGQISNDACYYSESCPERGTAPYESCGGAPAEKSKVIEFLGL